MLLLVYFDGPSVATQGKHAPGCPSAVLSKLSSGPVSLICPPNSHVGPSSLVLSKTSQLTEHVSGRSSGIRGETSGLELNARDSGSVTLPPGCTGSALHPL